MTEADPHRGLRYRDAGVDIDAGNTLVERIRSDVKATHRPGMLGGLGGFGGLFELPLDRYRQPVLVSGTDGVGTKLKLAIDSGRHDGIGIDLVAMCVNDVLVTGAEPLFFLDYYATGQLDVGIAERVIRGIAEGCRQAGAGLIGGETAEMPGMYGDGDYDLAGFCVGVVDKDRIIDGQSIRSGDRLIGLASSGIHANGYSLVRRIIELDPAARQPGRPDGPAIEALLAPTRIYARAVAELTRQVPVRGLCHITGGGLTENLPRVLPHGVDARIDTHTWEWPEVFAWLQQTGGVNTAEMRRTFNCGVGMVAVVPAAEADRAVRCLEAAGETAWVIGEVVPQTGTQPAVQYQGGE